MGTTNVGMTTTLRGWVRNSGDGIGILTLDCHILPGAVEAHRAVQFVHSEQSFVRSRASFHVKANKSRSFFTVEIQDTFGRRLFLLKSGGVQSIAWRAILSESIRYT